MNDDLDVFDLSQIERLRDNAEARHDSTRAAQARAAISRLGAVQTNELSNSGKLFMHKTPIPDDSGRVMTTWIGDPQVWMSHFQTGPIIGRINIAEVSGKNSHEAKALARQQVTVTLKPGERVEIVQG